MHLRIPTVSILTAAGPGFWDAAMGEGCRATTAGLVATLKANQPNARAIELIRKELGMADLTLNTTEPLIHDYYTTVNLVTTTAELADPLSAEDAAFYRAAGKDFVFVGPLLDVAGAKRCGGTLQGPPSGPEAAAEAADALAVMRGVDAAAAGGRPVVYVSMGTVLTGDDAEHGWDARDGSALTGQQLCQAVYLAVFEELGAFVEPPTEPGAADAAPPLIAVALGPQPAALEGIALPRNVVCARTVAQVDLLRAARPALVVTHGGQNTLMETMSVGSPVVVCPGFGDQLGNAAKVEARGWGVKVDRPTRAADADDDGAAQATYRAAVRAAVRRVFSEGHFAARAQQISAGLERAEGVAGALRILQAASGAPRQTGID